MTFSSALNSTLFTLFLSLFLSPAPVGGKWAAEEFGAAVCALPPRGVRLFLLLRRLPGWAAIHPAEIPAAGEQRAHWLPRKTPEQVGNTKWYRKGKWTQQATAHTLWKIIRIYNVNVYLLPALSHYSSTSVVPAMRRFALGFFYLVVFAVFSTYYQDSYFTTDEFGVRLCPISTLTSMFYMSLSQLKFEYHVFLRRPSPSGTAVFIFWFGEKSVCINMSAAGWLR